MRRLRSDDFDGLPAGIPEGDRIVRVNTGRFAVTLAIVLALLVAACDKERCEPASQATTSPDQSADLRKAAENSVRISASYPESVRFRGVQVWPQAAPTFTPASGTVVMRQNGNIRIAPQGETIRVEPQGKELQVFGEAPGGWLQIGDTKPNGWVHSSLVQRR
jgi:hypothetical protein